jgi:hypothetical protein
VGDNVLHQLTKGNKMLNVTHTLEKLEIPMTSVAGAIQATREILGEDTIKSAAKFIKNILSLDTKFTDADEARITAFAVIEAIVRTNGEVADEDELLKAAVARANKHLNNPDNAWMYVKAETSTVTAPTAVTEIAEAGVSVAVKADGKIKRGGKAVIAEALFKKHVLESETPCDNACFVKILIEHGQFTLSGARTYAHNLRKQYGLVVSK